MSEEEKKAIVELKHFSNITAYWKQEEYTNSQIDSYIKTILNLIEKQQREIENLQKNGILELYNNLKIKYQNVERELLHRDKIIKKLIKR